MCPSCRRRRGACPRRFANERVVAGLRRDRPSALLLLVDEPVRRDSRHRRGLHREDDRDRRALMRKTLGSSNYFQGRGNPVPLLCLRNLARRSFNDATDSIVRRPLFPRRIHVLHEIPALCRAGFLRLHRTLAHIPSSIGTTIAGSIHWTFDADFRIEILCTSVHACFSPVSERLPPPAHSASRTNRYWQIESRCGIILPQISTEMKQNNAYFKYSTRRKYQKSTK